MINSKKMLADSAFFACSRNEYLYPKRTFLANPSCLDCLAPFHSPLQIPPDNSAYFQSNAGYFFVNENNAYDPDYVWRTYYSELAFQFSQSIHYYSKSSWDLMDSENFGPTSKTFFQPERIEFPNKSKQLLWHSTNHQIWRPFSPPPPDNETSVFSGTNIEGKIKWNPESFHQPAISPGGKLDHSTSSVFTPVKKRKFSTTFLSTLQSNSLMRLQAGSKPYICDNPECLKSFARNEELTRHKRIHSGYKPHHCTVCGKSFGRKDHLSKHLKTHLQASEKKVYVCCVSGCGHRYTRSDALTRHKSTAHSISKSKKTSGTKKLVKR